jgi:dimethylargininase
VSIAYTRQVSSTLADGERTHIDRVPIDLSRARAQHEAYVAALESLGVQVTVLPALGACPDAVFVEDTAIVLDGTIVITRPGAESRRPETQHMTKVLAPRHRLAFINAPGTMDGGDIIVTGRRILAGLSTRTSAQAVEQLAAIAAPLGYTVTGVPLGEALHLKSACTFLSEDVAIANPEWVAEEMLGARRVLHVSPNEPFGANTLTIGQRLIVSDAYPDTRVLLEKAGYHTLGVDVTELHKAEAGVTCMSIII